MLSLEISGWVLIIASVPGKVEIMVKTCTVPRTRYWWVDVEVVDSEITVGRLAMRFTVANSNTFETYLHLTLKSRVSKY